MVIIGALIGGMTNYLAIKMLFRPYEPIYFVKWRLPFTPGLIPKRRAELAEQLGRVVTEYLVTSDSLQDKVIDRDFQQKIVVMINEQIDEWLKRDHSLIHLLQRINPNLTSYAIEQEIENVIINENKQTTVEQLLPNGTINTIEQRIPQFSTYVIQQIELYLSSEEGKRNISESASKFLNSQGFIGNMVSSYLGEDGLAEKIIPAINMFLQSSDTQQTVEKLLRKEWDKLKEKDLQTIIQDDDFERQIARYIMDRFGVQAYLHKPLNECLGDKLENFKENWVPSIVQLALEKLSTQMSHLLEELNLFELVKKEVQSFDISRIERLVLEITQREMNMITYLGACLGGMIGLVQGIIVLWLS
ncbi:DUF445 domain-containing protein [Tenuibacillus multivorans]|nr:DUF445 family protein [Tenuibacillus multivorans]